ncbi:hypothetical protein K3H64_004882 [Escherichia coli]|uniref:hypothetical protein n=1 Tax=Escherichia coli TaxID=562 RepID=UPI0003EF1A2B|nr:hypothetical protein [Escherichia coli]EFA7778251.1 hypothetical protein [Escherichia coli O157:H7]EYZ01407.1 hypothetical protein BX68_25735 [Escherichia coli O177:NM str. 2010C-4558]EER6952869.1 hypothetical protein [Escherichia coli]EES8117346.1 hypothetical protein [Escherichia coli]EEV4012135.1 hypothetical protein [Escherichia coli]
MLKKSLQNEPQTASIPVSFAKLYREANQTHELYQNPPLSGFFIAELITDRYYSAPGPLAQW